MLVALPFSDNISLDDLPSSMEKLAAPLFTIGVVFTAGPNVTSIDNCSAAEVRQNREERARTAKRGAVVGARRPDSSFAPAILPLAVLPTQVRTPPEYMFLANIHRRPHCKEKKWQEWS